MTPRHRKSSATFLSLLAVLIASGCSDERKQTPADEPSPPAARQTQLAEPSPPDPLPADLSTSFTDHVLGYHEKQVPFEMILIPGDEAKGIKPFYVGKTEVSREMFLRWAYGDDIEIQKRAELEAKGLRPSPIYSEHIALHVRRHESNWLEYPALGMSWLTAQSYCLWLSEQTGKTYRLPTDGEWMHVLQLSGGVPKSQEDLLAQALLEDNVEWDDQFAFFPQPRAVAEGQPNKLGLVNLLGNATEWVQPTKEARWVRGGHFGLKADQLTNDWRAVEDQSVWNETYPQLPPSRFWYLDFFYTGLRLVCEVESIEL